MPLTKTTVSVWDGQTCTAGVLTESSYVDLTGSYSATAFFSLTNGATGPTDAARISVQIGVDEDNSGSADAAYDFSGWYRVGTTANATNTWSVDIPAGAEYVKFYVFEHTGQDVTADAWVVKTTDTV